MIRPKMIKAMLHPNHQSEYQTDGCKLSLVYKKQQANEQWLPPFLQMLFPIDHTNVTNILTHCRML